MLGEALRLLMCDFLSYEVAIEWRELSDFLEFCELRIGGFCDDFFARRTLESLIEPFVVIVFIRASSTS